MIDTILQQFKSEVDSYFWIILLNIALGVLFLFGGILKMSEFFSLSLTGKNLGMLPIIMCSIYLVFWSALGLIWVVLSSRVMKGARSIRKEIRQWTGPITDELLTSWIVRILAHFREHRTVVSWMIPVCVLCGGLFLEVAVLDYLKPGISITDGVEVSDLTVNGIFFILGIIFITTALYFWRHMAAWDRRIDAAADNGDALKDLISRR